MKHLDRQIYAWLFPLLILIFPFLLKLPAVIPVGEDAPGLGGDAVNLMYAWVTSSTRLIAGGELPLWTSYEGLTRPLYSNLQAGPFYLPTWILAAISGGEPSYYLFQLYILLHVSICSLGLYFLARTLSLERFPAFISALIVSAGGFYLNHVSILSMTASFAWVPWILFAYFRARNGNAFIWTSLFGLFASLSTLGGLPQPTYYAAMIVGIVILWDAIENRSILPFVIGIGGGALAFLLAAPSLLPGLRELPFLERGQAEWRWAMNTPGLLWERLISLFAPQRAAALEIPGSYTLFSGIAATVLAASGVVWGKIQRKKMLLICLCSFLFISLAASLGLDGLLSSSIPGYGLFKEHYRAGMVVLLLTALFAGVGLQKLVKVSTPRVLIAGTALILALVNVSVFFTTTHEAGTVFITAIHLLIAAGILIALSIRKSRFVALGIVGLFVCESLVTGWSNNLHSGVPALVEQRRQELQSISGGELYPVRVTRGPNKNLQTLDAALGLNAYYSGDTNQYRLLMRLWGITEANPHLVPAYGVRYYISDSGEQSQLQSADFTTLNRQNRLQRYQLASTSEAKSVELVFSPGDAGQWARLTAVAISSDDQVLPITRRNRSEDQSTMSLIATFDKLTLIKEFRVAWQGRENLILTSILIDDNSVKLKPALEMKAPGIFEFTERLPRAYLVPELNICGNEKQVPGRIINGGDLQEAVVVAEPLSFEPEKNLWDAEQWSGSNATFETYTSTHLELTVETPTPAYLVINDFYHPNWQAWVNEEQVPVMQANLAVRAIPVPEGTSKVELRYIDGLVFAGLWSWVGGLIVFCSLLIVGWRRPQNR